MGHVRPGLATAEDWGHSMTPMLWGMRYLVGLFPLPLTHLNITVLSEQKGKAAGLSPLKRLTSMRNSLVKGQVQGQATGNLPFEGDGESRLFRGTLHTPQHSPSEWALCFQKQTVRGRNTFVMQFNVFSCTRT